MRLPEDIFTFTPALNLIFIVNYCYMTRSNTCNRFQQDVSPQTVDDIIPVDSRIMSHLGVYWQIVLSFLTSEDMRLNI